VAAVSDETPLQQAENEGAALATERILLFTDAVVAIAITLLALELPVPEGNTNAELLHSAAASRPEYISFLISFVVIWGYWSGHRQLFQYVSRFDRLLAALNGLWLLMLVVTPFATKVIGGDGAFQARFSFYAAVQTIASLILLAMAWHIRRAKLYREGTPPESLSRSMIRPGVIAAAFAVSIPISFATQAAYVCWVAVPFLVRLAMRWTRRSAVSGRPTPSA
jgi:uncharacterized membrane protein